VGQPEEIGHAAAYLASDDASFVQASTLVVDGGRWRRVREVVRRPGDYRGARTAAAARFVSISGG
jgi:NAD(P)-dependent dehydrogenase (short-subunit alcohol dehydrogenase family)